MDETHISGTLLIPKSDEPNPDINQGLSDVYHWNPDQAEHDLDIVMFESLSDELSSCIIRRRGGHVGGGGDIDNDTKAEEDIGYGVVVFVCDAMKIPVDLL